MSKLPVVSKNKKLICEWDYEKNNRLGIFPTEVTCGSRTKAWWICKRGHSYDETINNRFHGNDCPYCSNHKVLSGYNDILTTDPDIVKEWDYEKNNELGIKPSEISRGSTKKVWWICKEGHNYDCTVYNRILGRGCPYCAGRKVLLGYNDLMTTDSEIAKEWDFRKNDKLGMRLSEISRGSTKKAWWLCKNGHSYDCTTNNRVSGRGCPYCANKKVLAGYNDLASQYPEIAKEWDYEKNKVKTPSEVLCHVKTKFYWKCEICNHSWRASVGHRTNGTGCPECNRRNRTSFPEQLIYFYVKNSYSDAKNGYTDIFNNGMELDIYLATEHIGIEYDGEWFHASEKSYERELQKYNICKGNGIKLIRIKEKTHERDKLTCDVLISYSKNERDYEDIVQVIDELRKHIKITNDIDIKRDYSLIKNQYMKILKENSLLNKFPEIAKEWDYEKNVGLVPEMFSYASSEKVLWHCNKCDNTWEATIYQRTAGSGCPYCAGLRTITEKNDIVTLFPELMAEWDYEKNIIDPHKIKPGSDRSVFWKCKYGHTWEAKVNSRTLKKTGCPYCSGNRVWVGFNDLATRNPKLAKEWHSIKNGSKKPEHFTENSGEIVWWKCPVCNNEWEAEIRSRNKGNGCSKCKGKKASERNRVSAVKKGKSFADVCPDIAKEWNYEKNAFGPYEVAPQSNLRVWWKCDKGHEWESVICNRYKGYGKCKKCTTKKLKNK